MEIFLLQMVLPFSFHERRAGYLAVPRPVLQYADWRALIADSGAAFANRPEDNHSVRTFHNSEHLRNLIDDHVCLFEQVDTALSKVTLSPIRGVDRSQLANLVGQYVFLDPPIPPEALKDPDFPLLEYLDITAIS